MKVEWSALFKGIIYHYRLAVSSIHQPTHVSGGAQCGAFPRSQQVIICICTASVKVVWRRQPFTWGGGGKGSAYTSCVNAARTVAQSDC